MSEPTGILKNTATGRFHPITFRRAPMPGRLDEDSEIQRYKSRGHHTNGFDTIEAAEEFIRQYPNEIHPTGRVWEWDGNGIPAMVDFFPKSQPATPARATA